MIHVTNGRARVGLLSNNGRKNMQKKPVIGVSEEATAYRASLRLSSVLARNINLPAKTVTFVYSLALGMRGVQYDGLGEIGSAPS